MDDPETQRSIAPGYAGLRRGIEDPLQRLKDQDTLAEWEAGWITQWLERLDYACYRARSSAPDYVDLMPADERLAITETHAARLSELAGHCRARLGKPPQMQLVDAKRKRWMMQETRDFPRDGQTGIRPGGGEDYRMGVQPAGVGRLNTSVSCVDRATTIRTGAVLLTFCSTWMTFGGTQMKSPSVASKDAARSAPL